jgi:phosphatidate cytidylyltransferase
VIKRVLTALVLAPAVLMVCLLESPYPLLLVLLLVATLSFWELRQLFGQRNALPVLTLFGIGVPFFGVDIQGNRDPIQVILYACVFWFIGVLFLAAAVRKRVASPATLDLAGLWISMPLACLLMIQRLMPAHPHWIGDHCFILLVILPVWAGDIAAFLIGSRFGKHPLASTISPKKTWEGAIANFAACVLVGGALTPVLNDRNYFWVNIGAGASIGVFGQLGDLFESGIKRKLGAKDSGTILPGHGGILDRIDSLLFAAPVVSLLLVFTFR